jgi:hypothetical protein
MLTDHERAILFLLCEDHLVAHCARCQSSFRFAELGRGHPGRSVRPYTCPDCRVDVTASLLRHIEGCRNFRTAPADEPDGPPAGARVRPAIRRA